MKNQIWAIFAENYGMQLFLAVLNVSLLLFSPTAALC